MAKYSIGVDLGGTNFRAAAIDRNGNLIDKVNGTTNIAAGREAIIQDIVDAVLFLRNRRAADELAGIGIALPGFIVMETGTILASPNIPPFDNFPARDAFQQRLNAPVILENDANAAALGEKWLGAGRGVNDLVLMTLGTGIGGGIISDGRVLHGFKGMAGETRPCHRGSLRHAVRMRQRRVPGKARIRYRLSTMARHLALGDNLTSKDVYDLAMQGNPLALRVFECMGKALGIALATYNEVFNFPLYLLSGGPLAAWDLFAPAMFAEVERRSFTYRATRPRIEKAMLGSDAGLFGAAYLPFQATQSATAI